MVVSAQRHILIIDSDEERRTQRQDLLGSAGFEVTGLAELPDDDTPLSSAHVIVLTSPNGMDGRPLPETPTIHLGESDESTLSENCSSTELLSAIRGQLRKTMDAPSLVRLRKGVLHLNDYRLMSADGEVMLTPLEVDLIQFLLEQGGAPCTRDQLLVHVWGYRPGIATRAIDQTVARLRNKIERDKAKPDHLLSIRGVGYRFVLPEGEDESVPGPPPSSVIAPAQSPPKTTPLNLGLSASIDRFFGQTVLLSTLKDALEGKHRLHTLHGPPGIGKSRMAIEALHHYRRSTEEPRPVLHSDISNVETLEGLLHTLGRSLGLEFRTGSSVAQQSAQFYHALQYQGAMVCFFDNCDRARAMLGAFVIETLQQCPEVQILATSRSRLRIRGERVLSVDRLTDVDGLALFCDRADIDTDSLSETKRDTLLTVIERLEGIPLAIELAASRSRLFSPSQILERLKDRFGLLRSRQTDVDPRQKTLFKALDWSWQLLRPDEQCALEQCTVFADGFTLTAAEAVIDLSHLSEPLDVDFVLQDLLEKSWITTRRELDPMGRNRFFLLESQREFVVQNMDTQHPHHQALHHRHATYFAGFGEEGFTQSLRQSQGYARLRQVGQEAENIVAAIQWAHQHDPELHPRVVLALFQLPRHQMSLALIHRYSDPAVDQQDVSPAIRANLLLVRAARTGPALHTEAHIAMLEEALALARKAPHDPLLLGRILRAIASAQQTTNTSPDRIFDYLNEALVHIQSANRPDELAITLNVFGMAEIEFGRTIEAEAHYREALAITIELNDHLFEPAIRVNLANALYLRGDLSQSRALFEQAVDTARQTSQHGMLTKALGGVALLLKAEGKMLEAQAMYEQAIRVRKTQGNLRSAAIAMGNLATVLMDTGESQQAEVIATEALRIRTELGDTRGRGIALYRLAHVLGSTPQARLMLDEALEIHQRTNNQHFEAYTRVELGIRAKEADPTVAKAHFQEALRISETISVVDLTILARSTLAELCIAQDQLDEAQEHLARGLELAQSDLHRHRRLILLRTDTFRHLVLESTEPAQAQWREVQRLLTSMPEGMKTRFLSHKYSKKIQAFFLHLSDAQTPTVDPPTGEITLVLTDIEDSTAHWNRMGETFRESLITHDDAIRTTLAPHHGYEVHCQGDGFLLAFATPQQAVTFCLAIHLALNEAQWPNFGDDSSSPMRPRIRLVVHGGNVTHWQDPISKRVTYRGEIIRQLNTSATAIDGGQMLLSNTVWEELDPSMRQQLQPMISDPGSSAAPIPHRILNLDARPPDE